MDDIYEGIISVNINVISHSQYKILSSLCVLPLTVLHLQLKLMPIPYRMTNEIPTLTLNIPYMQCFVKIAMKQFLPVLYLQVQNR